MVAYYKEQFGLNGTLWDQYTHYLYNLLHGSLGPSFINFPTPVEDLLMRRTSLDGGLAQRFDHHRLGAGAADGGDRRAGSAIRLPAIG